MPLQWPLLLASLLLLSACASSTKRNEAPEPEAPLAASCDNTSGWQAGLLGGPRDPLCEDGNYHEAYRLGASLRGLRAEVAALQVQIEALGVEAAGAQIRQQRQRQVDIEAIQSLALINGWEQDQ